MRLIGLGVIAIVAISAIIATLFFETRPASNVHQPFPPQATKCWLPADAIYRGSPACNYRCEQTSPTSATIFPYERCVK